MKVASYLENIEFNSEKPALTLLLDTSFSKEIRVVFQKGQVMEAHEAPFPIAVHIVKGVIDFEIENEKVQLSEGDLIALNPREVHSLLAVEKSIVRLTLSKVDSLQRVKNANKEA